MKRYWFSTLVCLTLCFTAVKLFADTHNTTDNTLNIPDRLGWVTLPASQNICCGYYADPLANFGDKPLPPLMNTPVTINANTGTFHQAGTSLLIGNVTLAQPGRLVSADRIAIHRNPENAQPVTADLYGNVTLREPGKLVTGDAAHLELHSKVAHFMHALYRMALNAPTTLIDNTATTPTLTAWGKANAVHQDQQGIIKLIRASYSTCAPTTDTWQVNAKNIILNRDTGRGYAYNAWLNVKNIPIFYTPYFNFPIDKRRQSGFLFPTLGSSSTSGFNFTTPYYWNIAPNYDDLITPHFYTKRGVQLNNTFRYLTNDSYGNVAFGYLPHDSAFSRFQDTAANKYIGNPALGRLINSSDNRSSFLWQDNTVYNNHWSSNINYNSVSDDYYLQDFGNIITTANNQLPEKASVNYAGENWNFNGLLQGYQTLHPVNQSVVSNPYNTLPQLNWNGSYPSGPLGLQYQLNNQFTYFDRSQNPGETTPVISAARINIQPGVSLPITDLSGFITPALQLALTHYNIGSQTPGFQNDIQRTIPIFDIDSGLYFDRHTQFWGSDYEQTLEPQLFYLYVPYRNQNNLPLFDTGLVPFSYDSLFMTNRFSGLDRIGDANQLTYAITTRFLDDDTGAEKFMASVGEIYYFHNRNVNLCTPGNTPSATSSFTSCNSNSPIAIGATSSTEKFSPIAGQLAYHFNPAWSATANTAWDPRTDETVNSNVGIQYKPGFNRVLNLNYNFIRYGDTFSAAPNQPAVPPQSHQNDLNQTSFSFAWPIREHWDAVGGYTYNVSHEYSQTYFYGVEYNSCCWAIRLVSGRSFVGLNQNNNPIFNNGFYLQWQFKGLATVGTEDPSTLLMGNIPGYQDTFQPLQGSSI